MRGWQALAKWTRRATPAVLAGLLASAAWGAVVELEPVKDNTLYESELGGLSNGQGIYFFTGMTLIGEIRRGLLAFDVAGSVPAGSTVTGATLELHMSMTIAGAEPVALHRVLQDWGEAGSNAPGEEGAGGGSTVGDATWIHAFLPEPLWNAPGGDFEPSASASQDVGNVGDYTWSSPALVSDVQAWLDRPATSFGWVLVGNESEVPTAKRFNTREHTDVETRPTLTIEFTPPPPEIPSSSWPGIAVLALALFALGTAETVRRTRLAP